MPALHFYSASTSAIEILEKKNDIIISPSRSLHCAQAWIDVCVVLCVCMSVEKVRTKFFKRSFNLFKKKNLPV